VVPETLWLSDFAGTNKDAKTHLQRIKVYNKNLFETSKPEKLISRILEIATNEKETVLDCFMGSGTTASVAHKMNRRYICIEKNTETCDYVLKRMNRVLERERGGISSQVHWHGGGEVNFLQW